MEDRVELHRVRDDRCQQRTLGPGERFDVLAPVGLGGGLHAIGARSEVHGVEVQLQDLVLRELLFEPDGEGDLLGLAREHPVVAQQRLLHQLLGDRRAALVDTAGLHVLHERPQQATQVDAAVLVELGILDREHRLHHRGRDPVERHGITVLDAMERGEQGTIGGEHLRAHRVILELRTVEGSVTTGSGGGHREDRRHQQHARDGHGDATGGDRCEELPEPSHRRPQYRWSPIVRRRPGCDPVTPGASPPAVSRRTPASPRPSPGSSSSGGTAAHRCAADGR